MGALLGSTFLGLLSLAAGWIAQARSDEDVTVRDEHRIELRLEPGKAVRYRVCQELVATVTIEPVVLKFSSLCDQQIVLRRAEEEAAEETALDLELGRAHGWIEAPNLGKMEFDSDDEDPKYNPLFEATIRSFTQPVGHHLRLELSRDARVRRVEGWEAIFEGTALGKALEGQGVALTDEQYLLNAQSLFPLLPPRAISADSSWDSEFSQTLFEHTVLFRPRCTVTRLDEQEVQWSSASLLGEEDLSEAAATSRSKEASKQRLFLVENFKVKSASLLGLSTVSLENGLATHHTLDMKLKVALPNPLSKGELSGVIEHRFTVERLEAPESPPGDADE